MSKFKLQHNIKGEEVPQILREHLDKIVHAWFDYLRINNHIPEGSVHITYNMLNYVDNPSGARVRPQNIVLEYDEALETLDAELVKWYERIHNFRRYLSVIKHAFSQNTMWAMVFPEHPKAERTDPDRLNIMKLKMSESNFEFINKVEDDFYQFVALNRVLNQ